jgi:hypothetical protein
MAAAKRHVIILVWGGGGSFHALDKNNVYLQIMVLKNTELTLNEFIVQLNNGKITSD